MSFQTSVLVLAALAAAGLIVLLRKGLLAIGRREPGEAIVGGHEVAFSGPAPGHDEASGKSLYAIVNVALVMLITLFDVILAGPAVKAVALLLGFSPQVTMMNLPNGNVLLGTLVIAFLWVQLGHFVRLRSVWTRCRFVCLLVSLPLLMRLLLWLAVGHAECSGLLSAHGAFLAGSWSLFFASGIVPLLTPAVHSRLFSPVATWVGERIGAREAAEYLGNALLFAVTVALIAAALSVFWRAPSTMTPAHSAGSTKPVPSGLPHICMNDYPLAAQRLGEHGVTVVSFTITAAGTVRDVAVIRSSGSPRLDAATVECVTRWTYDPATLRGRPVSVRSAAKVIWMLR